MEGSEGWEQQGVEVGWRGTGDSCGQDRPPCAVGPREAWHLENEREGQMERDRERERAMCERA